TPQAAPTPATSPAKAAAQTPALAPAPAPAPDPAKGARQNTGGKKPKKGGPAVSIESVGAEETDKLLEALDAGFDGIMRPSEIPGVFSTSSAAPKIPPPA